MRAERLLLLACVGLLVTLADARSEGSARLDALQDKYRCPIAAYLAEIRGRPVEGKDRFLVLAPRQHPGYYVQCLFFDGDRQIRCEAASGYYDKAIAGFATPKKLSVLAALGFSTDSSKGNFVLERPVGDPESLYEIAGLLVEALARVYDLHMREVLDVEAPLVSHPARDASGSRHCTGEEEPPAPPRRRHSK